MPAAVRKIQLLLWLAYSPSGKGIISGHADGTIVRYFLEDEGAGLAKVSYTTWE